MSSATTPLFKPTSMLNVSLTTHPTLYTTKVSYPFLSLPSKPIKLLLLSSSSSFPSCVPLKKKTISSSVVSLVSQTSEWAQQEEHSQVEEEEESGGEGFVEEGDTESYPEPPEEAKLFVGNLSFDIDSEKLAQLFDQAGIVEIAEVIYNRDTDQSRGFGFVTMSTVEEAEKAVEMFNRYDVNGRLLTVNKASPKGSRPDQPPRASESSLKVYVGNLPWQVDDDRLHEVFSGHCKVVDARVVYDRETGRSRGFGFVTMSSQTDIDDAITALDGQSLDGRSIRVNVAEQRPRRGSF